MSGRRCKALRAEFAAERGRAPNLSQYSKGPLGLLGPPVHHPSEWRRIKKGYRRRRADRLVGLEAA
jgi:hypothetical protein